MIEQFLLAAGTILLLLMILLIIQSGNKERPQLLLIAIFSNLLFLFLSLEMDALGLNILFATSFLLSNSIGFTLSLLLLAYTTSLFKPYPKPYLHWLHFVVPLVHILWVTLPLALYYAQLMAKNDYVIFLEQQNTTLALAENVFMLGYLLISIRQFQKRYALAKAYHSGPEIARMKWTGQMLSGAMGVLTLDVLISLYELVWTINWDTTFVTVATSVVLCFYLAYFGIRQQTIFLPYTARPDFKATTRSALDSLSTEEIDALKQRLQSALEVQEIYKQGDLTLANLAAELETSDKKLSALINQHLHTNFYDLVNSYRVASVKERLANPNYEKYSLLGIAMQCGFTSKTGFHRVFKKHVGMSASAYKATIKLG